MSESKENDNGRYFEYLIAEKLIKKYKVNPTKRAKNDQLRDSAKNIDVKTKEKMINSLDKICSWIESKISLSEKTILDRLPDVGNDRKTHDDISLENANGENLSFSIKHNDLGFLFKISLVNAPFPGPISIIFLFLIVTEEIIFLITFLSIK